MRYVNSFKSTCHYTAYFYTRTPPTSYRGYFVSESITGSFDVVRDGFCIAQRTSFDGAKGFIDIIFENPGEYLVKRCEDIYNHASSTVRTKE